MPFPMKHLELSINPHLSKFSNDHMNKSSNRERTVGLHRPQEERGLLFENCCDLDRLKRKITTIR